jgi:hypothetical protein
MRKCHVFGGLIFSLGTLTSFALAQQPQPSPQSPQQHQPPPKPTADAVTPRLTSAKTVMVTRARGSQIPYDVISSTLDGWGRFTMVDTADKADLVITVATSGGDSSARVSASSGPSPFSGRHESSSGSSVDLSNAEIVMTVYDARTKRVLWTAAETAKSAMKQTARENNLVEAAEKLASKFHDRLEPPPKMKTPE